MLFAMFYFNWVGVFGSLIATVLLIVGLTFGLRLLKVSHAPAWAIACVAILGVIFVFRGGGETVILMLLFGVPLLGAAIYLIAKTSSAKQVGIGAAVCVFVVGFLFLMNVGHETRILSEHQADVSKKMHEVLMHEQAAIVRNLREDFDRQRRELFNARIKQSDSSNAPEADSSQEAGQIETLKSSSGVAWYPEVDEKFDADNYPSMSAAGRALGRKLVGLIDHSTEAEQGPPIIQVHASQRGIHDDFDDALNELATVMRSQYPEAQVLVDHLSTGNTVSRIDPQAVSIQLRASVARTLNPAPWSLSEIARIVDVLAELDTGPNKVSTSVRMIDKPWVHHFDEFVNSSRGNGIVFDGRSGRLAMTQMEARGAALDDAVSLLTPLATEILKAQKRPLVRMPNETEIAERLKKELLDGQLVVDRFSQKLTHPMGNFWREAVLVRVDYPWLERVFRNHLLQRENEQRDRLSLGAALTLLTIGVIVLHALLNWVTKGYHRKSVGVLSGLIAICGAAIVVLLALKFGFSSYGQASIEPTPPGKFGVSNETGRLTL
tara:strand:+ start:39752 stop:41398 length:1647 start_codon:yes stop_codon:yes gene_type:complete